MNILLAILQTAVFIVDAFVIGAFLFWFIKHITESFAKDSSNYD